MTCIVLCCQSAVRLSLKLIFEKDFRRWDHCLDEVVSSRSPFQPAVSLSQGNFLPVGLAFEVLARKVILKGLNVGQDSENDLLTFSVLVQFPASAAGIPLLTLFSGPK